MSFRDLRNFTEMLRSLGFPRQVSIENFRQPNFHLVAEILVWLMHRFDPHAAASVPTDVEMESDRVLFIKAAVQFMATKAHVRLNAKRIYSADGYAVKELLKATSVLYTAVRTNTAGPGNEEESDTVTSGDFDISNKLNDLKQTRHLAAEITSRGAQLYALLEREIDLRDERATAIARGLEIEHIENQVLRSMGVVDAQIGKTNGMLESLAADEVSLETKIKKRQEELARNQKRLRGLQSVRPAFMDEFEKVEVEMEAAYETYVKHFRNLNFLEHQLEEHQRVELEGLEKNEAQLKQIQGRLRQEELRLMRGEGMGGSKVSGQDAIVDGYDSEDGVGGDGNDGGMLLGGSESGGIGGGMGDTMRRGGGAVAFGNMGGGGGGGSSEESLEGEETTSDGDLSVTGSSELSDAGDGAGFGGSGAGSDLSGEFSGDDF